MITRLCLLYTLPRFASTCAYTAVKATTAYIAPRVRKADAEAVRMIGGDDGLDEPAQHWGDPAL